MKDIERLSGVARDVLDGHADFNTPMDASALVRAILQALREPSEETYQAGWTAFEDLPIVPHKIWQAMIDHILAEMTDLEYARHCLTLIKVTTEIPHERKGDLDYLRSATMLAHSYAKAALAPTPAPFEAPADPPTPEAQGPD